MGAIDAGAWAHILFCDAGGKVGKSEDIIRESLIKNLPK
jgi:hypothetical protein